MKSEWYVSTQVLDGKQHFIAERMLDKQKVKHSGNIEHKGLYTTCREEAEELVAQLNEETE